MTSNLFKIQTFREISHLIRFYLKDKNSNGAIMFSAMYY